MKPTAWLSPEGLLIPHERFMSLPKSSREGTPLYPRREWQGLTDEELRSMCKQTWVLDTIKQWAKIIEAKLREKNNG